MTPDELLDVCRANGVSVSLAGLIREADVARLLGVGVRTLQRWRLDSVGPSACAIGRSWSYSLTEIAATLTPDDKQRHSSIDDDQGAAQTQAFTNRRA
jgi:hypothetical protein